MDLSLDQLYFSHPIGVACSGGRDSMALLDFLNCHGVHVTAIHINHGLRDTAARDAEFVRSYCNQHGIGVIVVDAPNPPIKPSEEAARNYRYACFDRLLNQGIVDYIALAHHANDNTETVLLHLIRGCGVDGLCGMQAQNGRYLRPLLHETRETIDQYVTQRHLSYVEDETNQDLRYARNLIRNKILPLMAQINPKIVTSVTRLSEQVQTVLPTETPRTCFPLSLADRPDLSRLIYLSVKQLIPVDIEGKHIKRILSLFHAPTGTIADVKSGLRAYRDADAVVLRLPAPDKILTAEPWSPDPTQTTAMNGLVTLSRTDTFTLPDKPLLIADATKIPSTAVWRTRRTGDLFTPFGGGTRPLKEYLIDRKIPARKRDDLILLCVDSEVLVIVGVEISAKIKIDKPEESGNYLLIGAKDES